MKKIIVLALSIPFLIVGIAFDIVKLPVIIIFSPIWFLLYIIDVLNGDEAEFIPFILESLFIGLSMWFELVDLPIPTWMDL